MIINQMIIVIKKSKNLESNKIKYFYSKKFLKL